MSHSPVKRQFDAGRTVTYASDLYQPGESVTPVRGLDAVDGAMVEQYRALGFVSIASVFTTEDVEAAQQGLADLIMGRKEGYEDVQFEAGAAARLESMSLAERECAVRKLMGFVNWDARLNRMAAHEGLMALVRTLLGGRSPKLFQDMALLKPPGGREKPWHQDKAYFDIRPDEPVVGLWIALDEATPECGCMHLIPGSHRAGPVVHFKRRDWQICDSQVGRDQVAAPLQPGGVLVFDGLIHHGTPANPTEHRRRALQFHYAPEDAVWTEEEERLAVYGGEGSGVAC